MKPKIILDRAKSKKYGGKYRKGKSNDNNDQRGDTKVLVFTF